ncbi:MAG: ABC transporter permease [Halobacteriales archaeon]
MKFLQSIRMSWRAITDHPLRSVLTTLGIVIGIAAVITFVTLGASLQAAIVGDVAGETSPEMAVSSEPPSTGGGPGSPSDATAPVFTEHDLDELRALPNVERVVPTGAVQTSALERGDQRVAWQGLTATTAAGLEARTFASGEPFADGSREVVVNEAAAALFSPNLSVGDTLVVRLSANRSVETTVVGVLESGDSSAFGPGAGASARVYVPTDPFYDTTVESPTTGEQQRVYAAVTVRATDFESVDGVQRDVETYLNGTSDAAVLKPATYEITVQTNQQLIDQIQEVLDTFTGFITGIAVLSLIVGSIGIANIMLVSVTERTREIGIMKAVGAQRRDVLQLFLIESTVLGLIGAVVGTALGAVGGYAVATYLDLPVVYAYEWFAVAVVVGIGVGIAAGLYPAWNAARVDPIEALRRE